MPRPAPRASLRGARGHLRDASPVDMSFVAPRSGVQHIRAIALPRARRRGGVDRRPTRIVVDAAAKKKSTRRVELSYRVRAAPTPRPTAP